MLTAQQPLKTSLPPPPPWPDPQQHEVFEPVTRAYDIPLVSYRDVVWPERAFVADSNLFQTEVTIHPAPHIHQLIADLLSFWWWRASALLPGVTSSLPLLGQPPPPRASLPPPRFQPTNAYETCESASDANESHLSGPTIASFPASSPARLSAQHDEGEEPRSGGWRFETSRQSKEGWLYSATTHTRYQRWYALTLTLTLTFTVPCP